MQTTKPNPPPWQINPKMPSLKTVGRCAVLGICWLLMGVGTSLVAADFPANRYNVLFIAMDDLRPELGCYGVTSAQSPHLDRFAKRAILFERHYVQVATCGASRYALLTGRSPARSKVTRNNAAAYTGSSALKAEQQPVLRACRSCFGAPATARFALEKSRTRPMAGFINTTAKAMAERNCPTLGMNSPRLSVPGNAVGARSSRMQTENTAKTAAGITT